MTRVGKRKTRPCAMSPRPRPRPGEEAVPGRDGRAGRGLQGKEGAAPHLAWDSDHALDHWQGSVPRDSLRVVCRPGMRTGLGVLAGPAAKSGNPSSLPAWATDATGSGPAARAQPPLTAPELDSGGISPQLPGRRPAGGTGGGAASLGGRALARIVGVRPHPVRTAWPLGPQ